MPCYHPLKAIRIGKNPDTGKDVIRILSEHDTSFDNCPGLFKVPCGKCIGCRLDYSRSWANRCMLELPYHRSSFFVTLTYDDIHVPRSFYSDKSTGEAHESFTLVKRDWQLFMKRLRKRFSDQKLRFFMCGEYGSETFRPHYHAIIFGLDLPDIRLYKQSPHGFAYYNSDSLQSCWLNGYAVAASVSWETCAYVARYVLKKRTGDQSEFYSDFNIQPEFVLMSRKPGLGRQYFDDHPEIYDTDSICLRTVKGGLKFKPPRYFDSLYDVENPERLSEVKAVRQELAEASVKSKLSKTTLSDWQLRELEEHSKSNRIKSLRRPL